MDVRVMLIKSFRTIVLTMFLGAIIALSGDQLNTQAQKNDLPNGYVGAQVNGKECEKILRKEGGVVEYGLNPELTASELEECKILIKDVTVKAASERKRQQFVPGEILVGFRGASMNLADVQGLVGNALVGIAIQEVEAHSTWAKIKLRLPTGLNAESSLLQTESAIRVAEISGDFTWVEPNYIAEASDTSWGLDAIGAPQAQSVVNCDTDIGVAIVDTGVSRHTELPNTIHLYDYVNEDEDASDDNGHGTYVASIAGGVTVGVCPGASIYAVKVLDENGYGTYDDIAQGILHAAHDESVHIINLSIGGVNDSQVLEDVISEASAVGKLIFMASGNRLGEEPDYPALYAEDYENTLAVGAIDEEFRVAVFSSRFGSITRAAVAPGVDVIGADYESPEEYVEKSGTSAAAPFWAGSAALLWSADTDMAPSYVMTTLLLNTVQLGDPHEYGAGALNIATAIREITGADFNIHPVVAWPLPWPASTEIGGSMEVVALLWDLDGDALSVSATITSPIGTTTTVSMSSDPDGLWVGKYDVSVEGEHRFYVEVSDGFVTKRSPEVRFYGSRIGHVWGWSQAGESESGGSFVPFNISLSSHQQVFHENDSVGASNDKSVVGMNYRADIPVAVRIDGACPFGVNYGRRWFFNPFKGLVNSGSSGESVELSCYDGIGMFPEAAATNGTFFTYDEGTGDSPPGRLQSFDPWGRQFWLTQLMNHAQGPVRLSGTDLYVVGGMYNGLYKLDARTGEREWFFYPGSSSSIYVPPTVDDQRNIVIVTVSKSSGGDIYGLNAHDGSVAWTYSPGAQFSGKSLSVLNGETLILCGNDNIVYALDVSGNNPDPVWNTKLDSGYGCDSTPALLADKYVVAYVSTKSGPNILYILSLETGAVLASKEVVTYGSAWASPVVVGKNYIFLADYEGYIRGYRIGYSGGTPTYLEKVWEDEVDPYDISNWQLSAFVEDVEGQLYVTIPVSSNNGYLEGHRFQVTGPYREFEVYFPIIIKDD